MGQAEVYMMNSIAVPIGVAARKRGGGGVEESTLNVETVETLGELGVRITPASLLAAMKLQVLLEQVEDDARAVQSWGPVNPDN
ncbi:hypothetical protein HK101_007026 [Irineochytrium annulatum]|nr:hypothetical protein HK101_007026 [Irineochytrium annulatum]